MTPVRPSVRHGKTLSSVCVLFCLRKEDGLRPLDYAQRNAVVFIPQCDDVRAALHGVRSGGARQYSGDRDHIMLTPSNEFGGGTYDVILYALVHKQIHKRNNHFAVESA